jgi:hypothetical protein
MKEEKHNCDNCRYQRAQIIIGMYHPETFYPYICLECHYHMGKGEKYYNWKKDTMLEIYPDIPRCPICYHADYSDANLSKSWNKNRGEKK